MEKRWRWYGIDQTNGLQMEGEILAVDESSVFSELQSKNIILVKLELESKILKKWKLILKNFVRNIFHFRKEIIKFSSGAKKISFFKIPYRFHSNYKSKGCAFLKQLSVLISSNVEIISSLKIIIDECSDRHFLPVIADIKNKVESGMSLFVAMKNYHNYFSAIWSELIGVGEKTGSLAEILMYIANLNEKTEKQKQKLIKALTYPCIVLVVSMSVVAIMVKFIIPQFRNMLEGFSSHIPTYTKFIIICSDNLCKYWPHFFCMLILSIICFLFVQKRSQKFRSKFDEMLFFLPIYGKILRKFITAQIIRTICTVIKSGVPLVETLEMIENTIKNNVYKSAIIKIRRDLTVGKSFYKAISEQKIFPRRVSTIVSLGEETGTLDKVLYDLAEIYDAELDNTFENINTILEPFLIITVGGIVCAIVVGMYLPIFNMGNFI